MSKPEAILFDWDNTLVNTWPTIHRALNHTMRGMNHPEWTLDQVKANIKKSMRDAFPAMFGQHWEDAAEMYQQHYRSIHLDDLQPLPDAVALLDYLANQPVFVGVVSNKRGVNLRKELDHLGWGHYFSAVVGADDAEFDKPHIAPVDLALKDSGIVRSPKVWFVGDTIIDLECAQNAGLTAVLYGDVPTENQHYLGFPFHYHARNHGSLMGLCEPVFNAA